METQRITYVPQGGVCSQLMIIDVKEGVIEQVQIVGGCHGNTQGLSKLLVGMEVKEDGRKSFFAIMDKSFKDQANRIKEQRAKEVPKKRLNRKRLIKRKNKKS